MMEVYCKFCESYYVGDPYTHRYLRCVYWKGCACGLKEVTAAHVEKCFVEKERRRKEASRTPQTMIKEERRYCQLCELDYYGDWNGHRSKCVYYTGCPNCQKRYFEPGHISKCDRTIATRKNEVHFRCHLCLEYIRDAEWEAHHDSCPSRGLRAITPPSEERLEVAGGLKKKCRLCETYVYEEYLGAHQEVCIKAVREKFRVTRGHAGEEVLVLDRREEEPAHAAKGLKEVIFEEGD